MTITLNLVYDKSKATVQFSGTDERELLIKASKVIQSLIPEKKKPLFNNKKGDNYIL